MLSRGRDFPRYLGRSLERVLPPLVFHARPNSRARIDAGCSFSRAPTDPPTKTRGRLVPLDDARFVASPFVLSLISESSSQLEFRAGGFDPGPWARWNFPFNLAFSMFGELLSGLVVNGAVVNGVKGQLETVIRRWNNFFLKIRKETWRNVN